MQIILKHKNLSLLLLFLLPFLLAVGINLIYPIDWFFCDALYGLTVIALAFLAVHWKKYWALVLTLPYLYPFFTFWTLGSWFYWLFG